MATNPHFPSDLDNIVLRDAEKNDANPLYDLELECFATDRLSLRRFKHWIKAENRVLVVAVSHQDILAYGLALLQRGTRLARLYSIAVSPRARGLGLSKRLLQDIEQKASDQGRIFMRLEVARDNKAAIALYEGLGYQVFGSYEDYYDNHQNALRMQKRIRYLSAQSVNHPIPWYQQSTDFSCGPASLMMAMASFDNEQFPFSQELELDIWREATTIFMTSGHGGCHPVGLGLAAHRRGFNTQVYLNKETALFVDGVRNQHKKDIMTAVDQHFRQQAEQIGMAVNLEEISQNSIEDWLKQGSVVIILISTYRMDGKKTPHWVTVSGIDDKCLYVHDPDPDSNSDTVSQTQLDCQHLPIARDDFDRMSAFGAERLRTAVVISI